MPHADELITCKNCGEGYCAVCKSKCPKCNAIDVVDEKRQQLRKKRRAMLKPNEDSEKERIKKIISHKKL